MAKDEGGILGTEHGYILRPQAPARHFASLGQPDRPTKSFFNGILYQVLRSVKPCAVASAILNMAHRVWPRGIIGEQDDELAVLGDGKRVGCQSK